MAKGIGKILGSVKEAKQVFNEDKKHREAATRILSDTGLYDSEIYKELHTTLGGEYRAITQADLLKFRESASNLRSRSGKNKTRGGITASQIIAFAKPSPNIIGAVQPKGSTDMDRANRFIKMAVLSRAYRGKVTFITDASGTTKGVSRHFVNISFTAYKEAKAMPKDPRKPLELGKWLANSPLKFECDCGRHSYWFRYIASIGGWAEGRIENGYPKVRNPKLIGVACMHALRVMRELTTGRNVHAKLGDMLLSDSVLTTKQVDADRMSKQQKRKSKPISQTAAKRAIKNLQNKVGQKARKKLRERRKAIGSERSTQESISQINQAFDLGVIDQKTRDAAIRGIKGK